MKRNSLKWFAFLFTVIVSIGSISCGSDDKDDPSNPDTVINPIEPSKDNAMSPTDQKEYLETVALEFMDMIPSSASAI